MAEGLVDVASADDTVIALSKTTGGQAARVTRLTELVNQDATTT